MKIRKILYTAYLYWSWYSPQYHYRLGDRWIYSSIAEDLGILVGENLNLSQQFLKTRKPIIQDCSKRCMAGSSREVILPLDSIVLKSHLKCCIQLWVSQYKTCESGSRGELRKWPAC